MSTLVKQRLFVVLGMHRSGTSAITKSLELLGVGLGVNLYPAGFDNPKGFWEDRECLEINDMLLSHLDSAYDRLGLAWPDIHADSKVSALKLRATQLIKHKFEENNNVWGFKDPRTCRLLCFWSDVFQALKCEVNFIIAVRNPASVAASLAARNGIAAEKAYFLWLQHVLPSLSAMPDVPRVVVDYDEFLANPYAQLTRISENLRLQLPDHHSPIMENFENNFLDSGLRHSSFSAAELALDDRASPLVIATYSLLQRLAKDKSSLDSLDVQQTIGELNTRLADASPVFEYINSLELEKNGLLHLATERDGQIVNLNQALTDRESQITSFNQALTERESQITSFNQALTERESQITSLNQALTERESQITSLNQALTERESQITRLNQALTECENQITGLRQTIKAHDAEISALRHHLKEIMVSRSWRITKPLRALGSMARRRLPPPSTFSISSDLAEYSISSDLAEDFDPDFYLRMYPDIATSGANPKKHFRLFGRQEGRLGCPPRLDLVGDFDQFNPSYETVLMVSHEASLTGAPVLSLNLVHELVSRYNVVAMLLGGGVIEEAFYDAGAVVVRASAAKGNPLMAELIIESLLKHGAIKFALVNSIESRSVLPALTIQQIPSIILIHEFATYTRPKEAFREAIYWAGKAVFSSRITLENMINELPDIDGQITQILPQGRCIIPSQKIDQKRLDIEAKQILETFRPLGVDDGTVVILGAGVIYFRKGVDIFIECASRVVHSDQSKRYRFVWIGKMVDAELNVDYFLYLTDQIRRSGLENSVFFLDDTFAIETAYKQADMLVLSSRLDPLPNVAIDALTFGLPVLCFDKTTGIAEILAEGGLAQACVSNYLDVDEMAKKIINLASCETLRNDVVTRSRALALSRFNMGSYVAELEKLAEDVGALNKQERFDIETIKRSCKLRYDFVVSSIWKGLPDEEIIRRYIRGWFTGIERRKPLPGFHPGVYKEQHGLTTPNSDPFADYLCAGCPDGPWKVHVITPKKLVKAILLKEQRVALHLHVFYPALLPEILSRLKINSVKPDLFVSIPNELASQSVSNQLQEYAGKVVRIQIVPNQGRDIGPFLTAFGAEIVSNYDIVGHLHTKVSPHAGDKLGKQWYYFLLENLLGGKGGAMADCIISTILGDQSIGLVFPDDPHPIGWDANRSYAENLAEKLSIHDLPEHFNFPVGTMFWARTSILSPLVELGLDWRDYPEEPLPIDGTFLHAIERILPFLCVKSNTHFALTNVPGLTR